MSARATTSDEDQDITADLDRLEGGLHQNTSSPHQQSDDNSAEIQRATADSDREKKHVTYTGPELSTDDHVTNDPAPQQNQQAPGGAWSKAINWVKEKQQDRSWETSDLRPSSSHYAMSNGEAHQEQASGATHDGDKAGEVLARQYNSCRGNCIHVPTSRHSFNIPCKKEASPIKFL